MSKDGELTMVIFLAGVAGFYFNVALTRLVHNEWTSGIFYMVMMAVSLAAGAFIGNDLIDPGRKE